MGPSVNMAIGDLCPPVSVRPDRLQWCYRHTEVADGGVGARTEDEVILSLDINTGSLSLREVEDRRRDVRLRRTLHGTPEIFDKTPSL